MPNSLSGVGRTLCIKARPLKRASLARDRSARNSNALLPGVGGGMVVLYWKFRLFQEILTPQVCTQNCSNLPENSVLYGIFVLSSRKR